MPNAQKKSKRNDKFLFSWRNAVLDSELSRTTKFTLIVLSLYMNSKGFNAFPSIETLAERMSSGVRSVKRSIQEAKDAGFISIMKKRKGKDWNSNQYTATFPKKAAMDGNREGFLSREEFEKKLRHFGHEWLIGFINPADLNKALPKSELFGYGEEDDQEQIPVLDAAEDFLEDIVFYKTAVERYGDDLDDVWTIHSYRKTSKYIGVRRLEKMIEYIQSNGVRINLDFKPQINFSAEFPCTNIEKIPGRIWSPKTDL